MTEQSPLPVGGAQRHRCHWPTPSPVYLHTLQGGTELEELWVVISCMPTARLQSGVLFSWLHQGAWGFLAEGHPQDVLVPVTNHKRREALAANSTCQVVQPSSG